MQEKKHEKKQSGSRQHWLVGVGCFSSFEARIGLSVCRVLVLVGWPGQINRIFDLNDSTHSRRSSSKSDELRRIESPWLAS